MDKVDAQRSRLVHRMSARHEVTAQTTHEQPSHQALPDASVLRRLAVVARVDPRTLARLLRGQPVKGDAGHRGRKVLEEEGFLSKEQGKP